MGYDCTFWTILWLYNIPSEALCQMENNKYNYCSKRCDDVLYSFNYFFFLVFPRCFKGAWLMLNNNTKKITSYWVFKCEYYLYLNAKENSPFVSDHSRIEVKPDKYFDLGTRDIQIFSFPHNYLTKFVQSLYHAVTLIRKRSVSMIYIYLGS